jgi:hypothetical protein
MLHLPHPAQVDQVPAVHAEEALALHGTPRRWHGYMLLVLYLAYWTVSFGIFGGAPDRDGLTERYASTSVSRRSPASAFGSP